jgi:hypothetical protein
MKISRPSPALIVSIVAVVIACAGTATAASVLIKNSSQVKAGSINGSDIANRSVSSADLASGAVKSSNLSGSVRSALTNSGLQATEVSRRSGPVETTAGNHEIATMAQLAPGTYALFAKTTITPAISSLGLGELLRGTKTVNAECILKAGGDEDHGRQTIASPYSVSPSTVNLQMTRSIDVATDVKISCDVNDYKWSATDTSIIALKLSGSSRSDVQQ